MDRSTPSLDFGVIGHQDSWDNIHTFVNSIRRAESDDLSMEKVKNIFPFIPARDLFRVKVKSKIGAEINGVYVDSFIEPDKLGAQYVRTNIKKVQGAIACALKMDPGIVAMGGFTSIVMEGDLGLYSSARTRFTTGKGNITMEKVEEIYELGSKHGILRAPFYNNHSTIIEKGFVMNGQYERFIKIAGRFIQLLQGKKKVLGLFEDKSRSEQEIYFEEVWNTRRFHFLFKVLFNKRVLAKRGLVADYFHFDDGSKSFAESFYKRSKKVFRNIPIKGNYFISLYLLGKYQNDQEVPDYLKQENYELIKSRLDRIKNVTADAQGWIDSMPDESIDCFALSNICELMSEKDTRRLFSGILKKARKGARCIFRNLMIPREVPEELSEQIKKDVSLSKTIFENDRSFVYGKVAAYIVEK